MRLIVVLFLAVLLSSCTRPNEAERVLSDSGYTNIEIGGYDFFGCGKDDTFATSFKAVSPSGTKVNGVVCSDFFKGNTIRFH